MEDLESWHGCASCKTVYRGNDRWNFCPVCGVPLDSITLKVSPLETRHKLAYTVSEAARLTGLSRQTITRIFEREQGVIVMKRPETMARRTYRSIRIPRPVYERVIRTFKVS